MSRPNPEELEAVIEELANAVQSAVGMTAIFRQHLKATCDYAFAVDCAITRAVVALKRLQPTLGPGERKR